MIRRHFLQQGSALGVASLLGISNESRAEPPPEVSKIRLVHTPVVCFAPAYMAEALLRLEGFSEVEYIKPGNDGNIATLTSGQADFAMMGVSAVMLPIDAGQPVTVLAGVHSGCWELVGNDQVRSVHDLKGKRVAVTGIGGLDHVFISSIMAYVGMDPKADVNWVVTQRITESMRLFVEGKVDSFLAFAQQPFELRANKVGQTIVNTTLDRPWSQYFCCMASARRDFVQRNPVASKRALRAILKAADLCTQEPERVARFMASKGYAPRYELTLEVLKSLPYDRWRHGEPEDTLRFHALRLHEVGMIKSTPQKIIDQGTDWRFLNELKKELKV